MLVIPPPGRRVGAGADGFALINEYVFWGDQSSSSLRLGGRKGKVTAVMGSCQSRGSRRQGWQDGCQGPIWISRAPLPRFPRVSTGVQYDLDRVELSCSGLFEYDAGSYAI